MIRMNFGLESNKCTVSRPLEVYERYQRIIRIKINKNRWTKFLAFLRSV